QVSSGGRLPAELLVDRLPGVPIEHIVDLLWRHFAAQPERVSKGQVHALLAGEGKRRAGARGRLIVSGVVDVLQELLGFIQALVMAVLDVSVIRPAFEES